MSERGTDLPPEQQAIRDECCHPAGTLVEFPTEDVEISIPERFEKFVSQYPNQIAINVGTQVVTYSELNAMANCVAANWARTFISRLSWLSRAE
jgi:non-ribosomal peptide synthetase component F